MAKKELKRKIIATILTVTALGCVLGACVWLLMGSTVLTDTIRTMMFVCTMVLGVATLGLLVAKVQEIIALADAIRRGEELPGREPEEENVHAGLAPLRSLDETVIGGAPMEPPHPEEMDLAEQLRALEQETPKAEEPAAPEPPAPKKRSRAQPGLRARRAGASRLCWSSLRPRRTGGVPRPPPESRSRRQSSVRRHSRRARRKKFRPRSAIGSRLTSTPRCRRAARRSSAVP